MPIKILVILLIFAVPLIPTFWAIQDIPKRKFASPKKKIIWFLTVSTLPFIGAMFYIVLGRRQTQALENP